VPYSYPIRDYYGKFYNFNEPFYYGVIKSVYYSYGKYIRVRNAFRNSDVVKYANFFGDNFGLGIRLGQPEPNSNCNKYEITIIFGVSNNF
jgi:hypothetical protein